ncbi:MAG TPA: TIM barrel protein [Candidatus Sulfopaludibacter sp.]|nr:TIM barrel protein [Candidatus Sulfopaludibacter sp.]
MGKIALAAAPLARGLANINSKFGGVQIGAITYSFRGTNDVDEVIKDMVQCGLGEAELMSNHAEAAAGAPMPAGRGGGQGRGQGRGQGGPGGGQGPGGGPPGAGPGGNPQAGRGRGPAARTPRPPMTDEQIAAARERNKALHDWRVSVSMDKFKDVRKKFDAAGINIALFCYNMTEAITDEEIDYGFQVAKALGAKAISSTSQVSVSKRVAPFADKHKMMVGFHGHDATWDPNEFATPESFATAMSYSKYNGINLDIGHFTAANYDAVAFIKAHHARITNLHLKDRKKDHGENLPWGQGETPIKEVLLLLKASKYPIPANIEYEYGRPGMDTVAEVTKCVQFCKDVLS